MAFTDVPHSGTASWPSIGDIVERGKHLVFAADQSGDELIFHIHRSNDQDGLYAEVRHPISWLFMRD